MSTTGDYPFVRHDAQIAVAFEDEHGEEQTDDTAYRTFGVVTEAGDMPDPEVEWQEERTISNRGRELSGKTPGRNTYDGGSLTVLPVDAFPFEFLFGEEVGDTEADRITVANSPLPKTATVEATYFGHGSDDDFVRRFIGNAPESGTIQVDNEGQLAIDLDLQAQGVDVGTEPVSVDATDEKPWIFTDADSYFMLHGTEYARITDFEWELGNELDPRWYIQPNDPEDPYEVHYGNAGHAITVEAVPVDDSLYQEVIGRDDSGDASIAFEKPNGDRLSFEFKNVGTESAPHEMPDEGAPETTLSLIPDSGYVEFTQPA